MFTKAFFLLFVSLAILSSPFRLAAQTVRSEREVDEIKQDVSRLYRDLSRKIAVRLINGATIMGYINELDVDTFTMADAKTNKDIVIRYADVAKINQTGLSQTQKTVLVAAGIGALVTIGIIFRPKAKGGLRCLLCH
jgi:hypothetical protein